VVTIYDHDTLATESQNWQYYRGSMRYTIEATFPTSYAGSGTTAYAAIDMPTVEVEYVPYDYIPASSGVWDSDRGTMIQKYCERQLFNPFQLASGTGYLCPGTTTQLPNPPKIVLKPGAPVGQFEVPFDGIYEKRLIWYYNYNGQNQANVSACGGGQIIVRVVQRVPASSVTSQASFVPVNIRIHRAAGDDFRFIRFNSIPRPFWNLFKMSIPVTVGPNVIYDYQLYPSCLVSLTGWRTSGTALGTMKPKSVIDAKRRPRKPRLIEVFDDESDSDKSYIAVGEPQALTDADIASAVAGTFAEYMARVVRNPALEGDIACGLPRPTLEITSRHVGPLDYQVTFNYHIREHMSTVTFQSNCMLPDDSVMRNMLWTARLDMLEWALVNKNDVQTVEQQISIWLRINAQTLMNKQAFSILNEMQQHITGLTIEVIEEPPEGPHHALQHRVTVRVRCATGPSWEGSSTSGSKHTSKRDAAALCLTNIRLAVVHFDAVPLPSTD
jgi:hypothetical protein